MACSGTALLLHSWISVCPRVRQPSAKWSTIAESLRNSSSIDTNIFRETCCIFNPEDGVCFCEMLSIYVSTDCQPRTTTLLDCWLFRRVKHIEMHKVWSFHSIWIQWSLLRPSSLLETRVSKSRDCCSIYTQQPTSEYIIAPGTDLCIFIGEEGECSGVCSHNTLL
jgi:hypothetical protein